MPPLPGQTILTPKICDDSYLSPLPFVVRNKQAKGESRVIIALVLETEAEL
jgi:hypothetical protein